MTDITQHEMDEAITKLAEENREMLKMLKDLTESMRYYPANTSLDMVFNSAIELIRKVEGAKQ